MNDIYVMLPCYNESQDITDLLLEWKKMEERLAKEYDYNLKVYGIDDGSKDDTREIITNLSNKYDNIHLIAHEVNKGLGGVLDTAFRFFNDNKKSDKDLCLLMDGDNSHRPEYVFSMIEKIQQDDLGCVIASRYCSVSNVVGLSKVRHFLSDGAKIFYTMFLNVPNVKDYTCGYRLYTSDALGKLYEVYGDKTIENSSFACMMEALYKLHKVGVKFGEVPFELRYDMKLGDSKMNVLRTTKNSILTTIKLRFGK